MIIPDQEMKSSFDSRSTAEEVLHGIDLSGKSVLLTGCNSGLGFETLRVLTQHGAHVIAAARNLKTATDACIQVGGKTTPLACDLSDLSSVKAASAAILAGGWSVDRVIANAGIFAPPRLEQCHGLEKQFVVNYLGHFMLITAVLRAVPRHAGARIVIVSSSAHSKAAKVGIDFDNLSGERDYQPTRFYGQSNVARILFTRALARRVSSLGIAVNSLHPGAIADTNISRHVNPLLRALTPIGRLFTKNIPQGAATQCYLVAHPEVEGVTGKYFSDCKIAEPSRVTQDDELGERLWTVSEQLITHLS